ncbi:MAG: hypothetical protein AMJ42_01430 [Deltaproteobacteria bacterium DG_8]|nr:MAG: hypothetical protein AMJ42_01430 [Deltaproteobacteria bacterium DG_8]
MSKPSPPTPVKLITSLISKDRSLIAFVTAELSQAYGGIDFMSRFIPFTTTTYYQAEIGENLMRRFITFEKLIEPDMLPEVKRCTDELEAKHKDGEGNRKVNCDPGYIAFDHLILATNKKYAHRPYLRNGVYADLTLIYKKKSFQPLEWTYPDYGSAEIIEIMNRLRERYKVQLKGILT